MKKNEEEALDATKVKLQLYGYGEWIDEPDELRFEHNGIKCLILRNDMGALCGYCQLPEGHKYYEKDYNDILYEAHGGLTFSGDREKLGLDGFWIGFDCAHSHDITPSCESFLKQIRASLSNKIRDLAKILDSSPIFERTYKNMAYVEKECRKLAEQIINEKQS